MRRIAVLVLRFMQERYAPPRRKFHGQRGHETCARCESVDRWLAAREERTKMWGVGS